MSATAVIVLNAIVRDEFERDCHGFDEPFSFIEGDYGDLPPVETFTWEHAGTVHSLSAREVAELIIGQLDGFRYDIEEEEAESDDFRPFFAVEADMDEKVHERLVRHWTDQLEDEDEFIAVLDCRLDYLVKHFQEMVADFNMICERMPEIRPQVEAKLQEVHDLAIELLDSVKAT